MQAALISHALLIAITATDGTTLAAAAPIAAAALGGLAVGIERQWSGHAQSHFAGVVEKGRLRSWVRALNDAEIRAGVSRHPRGGREDGPASRFPRMGFEPAAVSAGLLVEGWHAPR